MTALRIRPAIFAYLLGLAVLLAAAVAGAGTASADTGGMTSGGTDSGTDWSLNAPGQLLGKTVTFSGNIAGARNGETIEIQRADASGWTLITTTTADSDGNFSATWIPTKAEKLQVRAVPTSATFRTAGGVPTKLISVYKSFNATWFGPGFYGNRTSCGKRLTRKLLGVAHKKLKCGSKVELFYKGRTLTVPVVDRGPFRHKTEFDLTYAAAKKLKFKQTAKLGALSVQ